MANEKTGQCMLPQSARSCPSAVLGDEFCEGCGWNAAEQARRKRLPLEQGEDGRYGKHIGVRPDCRQTQQSAGDT